MSTFCDIFLPFCARAGEGDVNEVTPEALALHGLTAVPAGSVNRVSGCVQPEREVIVDIDQRLDHRVRLVFGGHLCAPLPVDDGTLARVVKVGNPDTGTSDNN